MFLLLIMMTYLNLASAEMQLIKTIGDDREDYVLMECNDALLTENNDIYILNKKGNFISHYDWKGNFIRRIGRKGSGPGDLSSPGCMSYRDKKLYVLENGNRRVTIFDTVSNEFSFYKENENTKFGNNLVVINENKLLGIFRYIEAKRGRIGIVDKNFNVVSSFFAEFPVEYQAADTTPGDSMSPEFFARREITAFYFSPVCFFDEKADELLVSFRIPDNPVLFFVYNIEGKLLKKFQYVINEKKYKFPSFILSLSVEKFRNSDNWPTRSEIHLDSVFIYKDYYIAFMQLEELKKHESLNNQKMCLIFDKQGILKESFQIEKNLRIFRLSNGYFLGTVLDEEIEKLYIYQLNL